MRAILVELWSTSSTTIDIQECRNDTEKNRLFGGMINLLAHSCREIETRYTKPMTLAEDAVIKDYLDHGFRRAVVRRDEPNFNYPIHFHAYDLAFQVIEGDMAVVMNHKRTVLHPGDHALIPPTALHSVHIGPQGCVFIHAEKEAGYSGSAA